MSAEEIYAALVARFWERQKGQPFKPVDIALYLHLIDKCYSLNWKSPFSHSNGFICDLIDLDRKTLAASRERLIARGEIGFIGGGKSGNDLSEYLLLDLDFVTSNREGKTPPLASEKGGKNSPPSNNREGKTPPLASEKASIPSNQSGRGGKIPPIIESIDNKGKKGEENNTHTPTLDPLAFDVFWDLYGKKEDTKKCRLKWASLSDEDKTMALARVPAYVKSKPVRQYRKNPLTWLNGECWNDEDLPEVATTTLSLKKTKNQSTEDYL
jgi:hypothetical protein